MVMAYSIRGHESSWTPLYNPVNYPCLNDLGSYGRIDEKIFTGSEGVLLGGSEGGWNEQPSFSPKMEIHLFFWTDV